MRPDDVFCIYNRRVAADMLMDMSESALRQEAEQKQKQDQDQKAKL